MTTETIIVGLGLAGSVLANKMKRRGESFVVIDRPELSMSSFVAAGIWNPIVFKRLTSSWMAKEVIPEMFDFFEKAETIHQTKYFFPKKMLKLFTEKQEADLWKKKQCGELSDFIDERIYFPEEFNIQGVDRPEYGFSFVTQSGHVRCAEFIQHTRKELSASGQLIISKLEANGLKIENGKYKWMDLTADRIVFCEGWLASNNPFFSWIPFKPAKGEIVIFESGELKMDYILNKGVFVLPLGEKKFISGATYEWGNLNDTVTAAKQSQLEEKLRTLLSCTYSITERKAGVRPSVIDRRPVIGEHPHHRNMFLFNGFGTKAVMLAPYFAEVFLDYVLNNRELPAEVNITRFSTRA